MLSLLSNSRNGPLPNGIRLEVVKHAEAKVVSQFQQSTDSVADQCLLEENRESHRYGRNPRRALQFRQNPQNAEDHAEHGGWPVGSRMVARRNRAF